MRIIFDRINHGNEQDSGKERGSVMIESAFVLPVLIMLLFGVIQYGIILAALITLRNASAVAARTAVLETTVSDAQIISVAKDSVLPMLDSSKAVVTVQPTTVGGMFATQVSIQYDLDLFLPFIVPSAVNGRYSMISSTTMR